MTKQDGPPPECQGGPEPDAVELALAEAIVKASAAGAWDAVGQLARELEARRKARTGVVDLAVRRARK